MNARTRLQAASIVCHAFRVAAIAFAVVLPSPVPRLSAKEFIPDRSSFPGGDLSDLVEFCRAENVGVRYGSTAQLALAQLAGDAVTEAQHQIGELDVYA
jgi:hypothetical protein